MSDRRWRVLGWAVWAACMALVIGGLVLVLPHRRLAILNVPQAVASALVGVTFATIGGFLADRRPRHAISWLFLAIALSQSIAVFSLSGTAALATGSRSTWADVLTWVESWIWAPGFILIPTLLLQLFPTGRPLSSRWRWLVRATLAGIALATLVTAFGPKTVGRTASANVPPGYRSPVPQPHVVEVIAPIAIVLLLGCLAASVASIVLRYRRSRGEEREQLKWFTAAAVGTVVLLTGGAFVETSAHAISVATYVGVPLMPAATAIAILKYRLYDIDVVLNKAVVYGLLAAFITVVYVAIVVGIGAALGGGSSRPNLALSIAATAVVAVAFQPVRDRVQRVANRLVYGVRATPYEVLAGFVEQVGGTYAAEDVLPRMARALAEGTAAASAAIWLKVGLELRPEASWPPQGPGALSAVGMAGDRLPDVPGVSLILPIAHRDETLGALTLTKPPGEPLSATERKLAEDLAGQAGLVVRNVALTEDLLARLRDIESSRGRIVSAEDEERARIQRRIREGARRELEEVSRALDETATSLTTEPGRALAGLATVTERGTVALESLREVARGVYPPLLADKGLVAALEAQARRAGVAVTVDAEGVGRYPQDVEAAAYFCCVEAMENAVVHGRASAVRIAVRDADGTLRFEVVDDGIGFDPAGTATGIGVAGMRDRMAALDGELRIDSSPGHGTIVTGEAPVADEPRAGAHPRSPARSAV